MQRDEVEHVIRAAAAISKEKSFVLIGSQAVTLLLDQPPPELLLSSEVDLYPALHPEKADLIDGAIGALSTFHDTFGYHADGVGPETATLPKDWMARAKLVYLADGVTAICPELHDLAVSKCAAMRDKDAHFVRALFKHGLIELQLLLKRIDEVSDLQGGADIAAWARRRALEAQAA